MDSPQLTMESVETSTGNVEVEQCSSSSVPSAAVTVAVDEDEHDVCEPASPQQPQQQQPRIMGAPVSSQSMRSVQSTDQVLEMTNRLDLSDTSAIFSQLHHQSQQQQQSSSSQKHGGEGRSSAQRRISRAASFRRSASKMGRPNFSRRPSMHETHDSEPLMRGEFLYYLYSFAVLGTAARMFIGRFFGQDCEDPSFVSDFMTPLTNHICVTSSGTTLQHGGALFLDLPANMLGSFVMGLVSSLHPMGGRPGSKLPWLHKDHPLQEHEGIHHAIKVGLCGSLTTFSSWNTQMVLMMDGSETELGPQVVPALFGYIIGMACAAWCFTIGGRVHEWVYDWSNGIKDSGEEQPAKSIHGATTRDHDEDEDEEQPPTSWDSEDSNVRGRHTAFSGSSSSVALESAAEDERRVKKEAKQVIQKERKTACVVVLHKVIPFFISVTVLVAYGATITDSNAQFYRELFACSLLTPIGVHLRWKLAALNGRGICSSHKYEWVPWGTLAGNISAVVISVTFQALYMKHHRTGIEDHPYVMALLIGMKTGVAGSMSTVSSFAKEVVNLATIHPTHAKSYLYTGFTIITSMFLGLMIYSPIMRYS